MNSKITCSTLFLVTFAVTACPHDEDSGTTSREALRSKPAAAFHGHSAREVLIEKEKLERGQDAVARSNVITVDSAPSRANDRLLYYWSRVEGRNFDEFEVVAIAGFRDRYFDPANLQDWQVFWDDWAPTSTREALEVCKEAVAVGVHNSPVRVYRGDLLELGSALKFVHPDQRSRVNAMYRPPTVNQPSGATREWTVVFWYPDLSAPGATRRIGTRYLCHIPAQRGQTTFRVLEVDSLLVER